MVHLKLISVFVIFSFLTPSNTNQNINAFSCLGPDITPSESYQAKIKKSLELFSKEPKVKPGFLVKQTGSLCHNAWADSSENKIIISEPVLRDFYQEELSGIIAHEIAHLEFPEENEHWRTDLRGAELTSTAIMLKKLNRMLFICTDLKKLQGLTYSTLYNFEWVIEDYLDRIKKIKSYEFKESPK